jgi:hypothetical protein
MAPVERMTSAACSFGPRCPNIQSMASFGPAMKPSTDIETCHSTMPMAATLATDDDDHVPSGSVA